MEYSDIQPLLNAFHRKLAATDLHFKRYLYNRIDWNVRLIGIKGARGVGKTTMLMQHIREKELGLRCYKLCLAYCPVKDIRRCLFRYRKQTQLLVYMNGWALKLCARRTKNM